MTALEKITPMFLANTAFCIENGSDVKPETRESIIDTLIKASEELSQANAEMIAVTTRTQGADDQFIAEHGHRLAELLRLDYLDIADRDAQISMLLANKSPQPAADDAQPVAIYQVSRLEQGWFDVSERVYEMTPARSRRIVYATRATSADHISQARDAVIEECAKEADKLSVKYWDGYKRGKGPERANPYFEGKSDGAEDSADAIRALKSAPREKPAGDVSDI